VLARLTGSALRRKETHVVRRKDSKFKDFGKVRRELRLVIAGRVLWHFASVVTVFWLRFRYEDKPALLAALQDMASYHPSECPPCVFSLECGWRLTFEMLRSQMAPSLRSPSSLWVTRNIQSMC